VSALSGFAAPDVLACLSRQLDPPRFAIVRSRSEIERLRGDAWAQAQVELVRLAVPDALSGATFFLPGICPVERIAVRFHVQAEPGPAADGGEPDSIPNYRERMWCPSCGLNSRQRGVALAVLRLVAVARPTLPLLLLERESPLYRTLAATPAVGPRLVGSEFLGSSYHPGEVIDGIRHEDACRLSFASGSLAAHLSSDVLEHVAEPRRALREAHRSLAPGGILLFTIPFHENRDQSRRRAEIDEVGTVHHHAPPVFHGDPRRPEGALVVTDFGWDLLDWMRDGGFRDAAAIVYWDLGLGFVHPFDFLFVGVK